MVLLTTRQKKAFEKSYKERTFDLMCIQHAYVAYWVYKAREYTKAFEDQHALAQYVRCLWLSSADSRVGNSCVISNRRGVALSFSACIRYAET